MASAPLLPVQSRMARTALGWGVRQLAAAARVSVDTISRFERGERLRGRTLDDIRRAFEDAGIEFMNGGAPGVRVRPKAEFIRPEELSSENVD